MNAELRKVIENPEIKKQLGERGMDAFSGTPEDSAKFVNEQLVLWTRLIKEAGIEPE